MQQRGFSGGFQNWDTINTLVFKDWDTLTAYFGGLHFPPDIFFTSPCSGWRWYNYNQYLVLPHTSARYARTQSPSSGTTRTSRQGQSDCWVIPAPMEYPRPAGQLHGSPSLGAPGCPRQVNQHASVMSWPAYSLLPLCPPLLHLHQLFCPQSWLMLPGQQLFEHIIIIYHKQLFVVFRRCWCAPYRVHYIRE